MSGFVGLVQTDGRPVEGRLVEELTARMAYRGPDGCTSWTGDNVGLGHALFTSTEGPVDRQPTDLDGRLWISADARIDDREGLIGKLESVVRHRELHEETDARLILHAYDVWGDDCLWHLLGAYSFAIWDTAQRRLFCARDHIGIKPFYYAKTASTLLVGNTIEALRAHPALSDRLDKRAIADYLLFGINRFAERTSFAEIRRLPAAHSLALTVDGGLDVRRYWELQVSEPIRYRGEHEHVEHFSELLGKAVGDRLPGRRAAVLMSGGLDSTSIAATAVDVLAERHAGYELEAYSFHYECLGHDPERDYAAQVAAALNMPIRHLAADHENAADVWGDGGGWSAEPSDIPTSPRLARIFAGVPASTRVGLTGQGGDPLLQVSPADFAHRVRRGGWLQASRGTWRYRLRHGRLPRVGLRTLFKRHSGAPRGGGGVTYPPWLDAGLERRLALRQRFDGGATPSRNDEGLRPQAQAQLTGPDLSGLLEWYDAGSTGYCAEWHHPYLDLRLVEHVLAIPPIPWLAEKEIVRRAMAGRLPDSVLSRRKAAVPGFPVHRALVAGAAEISGLAATTPSLAEFVDIGRFLRIAQRPERLRPAEYELISRPLGLALWLRRLAAGPPSKPETSRAKGRHDAPTEAVQEA